MRSLTLCQIKSNKQQSGVIPHSKERTVVMDTQVQPVVRPVDRLVIETNCHVDELVAWFLGGEFGKTLLPGFDRASVTFSQNCSQQSPSYWAQRKIFCIGCGGDVTDEHTHGTGDRQKGECAASLMAKYVGVTADPAVRRILDETIRFDGGSGCPRGHMSEFVKAVHRRQPGSDRILMKWFFNWIKAVYDRLTLNPAPRDSRKEKTLSKRIEKIMSRKPDVFSDDGIRYRIIHALRNMEGMGDRYILSLPFILQSMDRMNWLDDDIDTSLAFFAEIMYAEEVAFRKLHRFAEKHVRRDRVEAVLNGWHCDLLLMTLVTNDEMALKVLLEMRADIILIVQSGGRPIIGRNEKIHGLSLNTARGMIRWLELEKDEDGKPIAPTGADGKPMNVSFEALESHDGTHPAVPQWYGVKYMIANGTTTHPGVPRTKMIPDAGPREVLLNAFHPRLIDRWKRERGIPVAKPADPVIPAMNAGITDAQVQGLQA
jgi:hypothetical protein